MLLFVNQTVINLIRDDHQVMFFGQLRNLQERLARGHRSGRVIGVTDENCLGARGDSFFNQVRTRFKVIRHVGWNLHCHAACQLHFRLIGHKTGCGNDDLIPRVQQRGEGQVKRFGYAYSEDNFLIWVVRDAV